jgi:hypothetical protein
VSSEHRRKLPKPSELPPIEQIRGTREELELICRALGEGIAGEMNDRSSGRPMGFCLWLFDFGQGGHLAYVSNARREHVIKMLREHLAVLEKETN